MNQEQREKLATDAMEQVYLELKEQMSRRFLQIASLCGCSLELTFDLNIKVDGAAGSSGSAPPSAVAASIHQQPTEERSVASL